jgi:tetraacyldisaccharide 4'-kinase
LLVLSWGYGFVVWSRRRLFELGVLPSKKLDAKVICIGNITTGGTGKTPAVLLAAQLLHKHHASVSILSRGYGRTARRGELVTLLDEESVSWTLCGDEPWIMHETLKGMGIPILVCPDRVKSGREAVTFYHSKVIVLDDGFQHLRLKRDLDVVLLNASDPFGEDALLPLGKLREPLSALSRAGLILLTHCELVESKALEVLRGRVQEFNAKAPIIETAHCPDFLLHLRSQAKFKISFLENKHVAVLSGLADPESFEAQIESLGAKLDQRWKYPDHHPYRMSELRSISKLSGGLPIITTFKDAARFPPGWTEALPGEVYALAVKLEILKGRTVWNETLLDLAGVKA